MRELRYYDCNTSCPQLSTMLQQSNQALLSFVAYLNMVSCYKNQLSTIVHTHLWHDTRSFVLHRKRPPFSKQRFTMIQAGKSPNSTYSRLLTLFGARFAAVRTRDSGRNRWSTIYHQVSLPLDSLFTESRWDPIVPSNSALFVPSMHYIGSSVARNRATIWK